MTGTERLDETTPGGRYQNQDGTRWVDANGNDLGPVSGSETTNAPEPDAEPETDTVAGAPRATQKRRSGKDG